MKHLSSKGRIFFKYDDYIIGSCEIILEYTE